MWEACPDCGRPKHPNHPYCSQCLADEKKAYRVIKEFLLNHPHSNAMKIANATGVSVSLILRYVREGILKMEK